MKYIALLISLIGMFSLFIYLQFSQPILLTDQNQMRLIEDNQKVIIKSTIISQKIYENNLLLFLEGNFTVNCYKPCEIKKKVNDEIILLAEYDSFYNSFNFKKIIK